MKVAVLGGTRGLGNWIARFLKERKIDVTITGRDSTTGKVAAAKINAKFTSDNKKAASNADIVIIAVPIPATKHIIKEVAPLMTRGSLLVDITSVKEEPSKLMNEYAASGVEILPTHPMFGPRIRSLDGQVVVLTPKKETPWVKKVIDFLESENVRVIVTNPSQHDHMMSVVQGLTHLAYISLAVTLERLNVNLKESRKFSSPVYSLMLDMMARIVAQNPYLYYSIQKFNPYTEETQKKFIETFKELMEKVGEDDQEEFVADMSSAAKHLDDLEASLGRSDKAINALNAELSQLKNSVGHEVGLRHIYTGNIHLGVLERLEPDFLILKEGSRSVKLKISNVEILDAEELMHWKINKGPLYNFDVSVVFPERASPESIVSNLLCVEGVVETRLVDVYKGPQIDSDFISITLNYVVLYEDCRKDVEKFLKDFGGLIR